MSEIRTPIQQASRPAHAGEVERASIFLRARLNGSAEALAVLGIVGFLLSGLLNTMVFHAWGLIFFQIAALDDALTSGMKLSFDLSIPFLLITGPFFLGVMVYDLQSVATQNGLATFLDKVDAWPFIALFLLILLIVAVASLWPSYAAMEIGGIPLYLLLVGVAMSTFLFYMWVSVVSGTDKLVLDDGIYQNRQRSDRLIRSGLTLIALLFSLVGMYGQYAKLADYGFLPNHWASVAPPGCEGRIMWMGERSIIVACGPPPHRRFAIISTQNAPGLAITDVPPARPAEAPPPPAATATPASALANPGFSTKQATLPRRQRLESPGAH